MTTTEAEPASRTAAERAAVGAKLLDHHRRLGWVRRITRPIDVSSGYHCPAGQAYGGWGRAVLLLGLGEEELCVHGFCGAHGEEDRRALNAAWEAEVAARRTRRWLPWRIRRQALTPEAPRA